MKTLPLLAVLFFAASCAAQELNTHLPLVRKLDALRLPPESFTTTVTVRKSKDGDAPADVSHYTQHSRRRVEADGRIVFDTFVRCTDPPRDAGKILLFVGDNCWFYDPPAKRAARLSSQQVAAQALVADLMNWRFAEDFDHRSAGSGTIHADGADRACTVLDFTPKPGVKNRSPLVRCWMDAAGRPWKAEHYTASKRLFRTVLFTKVGPMLGADRPVAFTVTQQGGSEEVELTGSKSGNSPDEFFDPDKLPTLSGAAR